MQKHPTPVEIETVETEHCDGEVFTLAVIAHFEDPPAQVYTRIVPIHVLQAPTADQIPLRLDFNCN